MRSSLLLIALTLLSNSKLALSFVPTGQVAGHNIGANLPFHQKETSLRLSSTTEMSTLTDETTWKLRFVLRGIPTAKGKKVDQIFDIHAQFIEEDGYEPPQGYVKQVPIMDDKNDIDNDNDKPLFQITGSRWLLSEDPNERKDGLWVWGLFKEPLYPFLLLQLQTESIPLPGEEGDSIEPLALFAQVTHKRDQEKGAILSRAELKIRVTELVKADLFGVSTAELFEEKSVGQCVFQPLV
ncbi:expressed unknown protein [Seminavis robusta]|uniref:Uncharacterized protein n=1 Tax=Seminavis robusta TaxID=568900 RepID=A0A9N8HX69_9STRA|nr:expressed unknown protein [Seminavis robusta]|eukprot:Sro2399_g326200.1 n/a (239) ;mRNA; r:11099-11815